MPQHPDWVPEGRDRPGFDYWRAYNQHMVYFDGFVHKDDWNYERWEGYETDGLLNYGFEFMDNAGADPFLLFLSPIHRTTRRLNLRRIIATSACQKPCNYPPMCLITYKARRSICTAIISP